MTPFIEIKNLCVSFDGVDVLRILTLKSKKEKLLVYWERVVQENPFSCMYSEVWTLLIMVSGSVIYHLFSMQ